MIYGLLFSYFCIASKSGEEKALLALAWEEEMKRWVPPYNVSAVPRNVRTKIPEWFRYWTIKDTTERRAVRDNLVAELKKIVKRWNEWA